jgi:high-affinity iron transporter
MNATFIEAVAILVREGLEAILVLAALAAYLSRVGAEDRLRALWTGAAAALIASIAAAWVFEHFYNGVHSDVFEGVIIFLAAGLLFYVSGWLFLKQDPRAWQAYLKRQTDKALLARTQFVVALLAFFAVLREGGETVLFLHVLAKTSGGWGPALVSGIVAAFAALAVLFWILIKTTRKLPLRAVFLTTSAFLFLMGLKFVGEGLQEFQEQALVPYDMAPGAGWLTAIGLNPTWEALGAQMAVVLMAIAGVAMTTDTHHRRPSTHA